MQHDFRIPSPQQSIWMTLWQVGDLTNNLCSLSSFFLCLLLMSKFPVCMLLYFFLGCQWPEMYNKDYLPLFQPLGNAAMNTRVFKEPRGFMRCVQWFFAIVAFGCCCDFSTHVDYTVECTSPANSSQKVTHVFSYPFQ